jgi:hypothetical protein
MTKITRIHLDLDGVLNVGNPAFLAYVVPGLDVQDYQKWYPGGCGDDLLKACNTLLVKQEGRAHTPITGNQFWGLLSGPEMWAGIPKSAEFYQIMDAAKAAVGDNHYILSSTTRSSGCAAGKIQWITEHCGEQMLSRTMLGSPKHLLAQPGAMLIDDRQHLVQEFRDAGGQAVLVPRAWNCLSKQVTGVYLQWLFAHPPEEWDGLSIQQEVAATAIGL